MRQPSALAHITQEETTSITRQQTDSHHLHRRSVMSQQQIELRLHPHWKWEKYTAVWLDVDTSEPQDQLSSAIIQIEADSCSISIRSFVSAGRQISFPGFMTYCVVVRNPIKL